MGTKCVDTCIKHVKQSLAHKCYYYRISKPPHTVSFFRAAIMCFEWACSVPIPVEAWHMIYVRLKSVSSGVLEFAV